MSSLNDTMEFSLSSWGVFLAISIPHIWGLMYFILHTSMWLPALELYIGGKINTTLRIFDFLKIFINTFFWCLRSKGKGVANYLGFKTEVTQ